MIAVSIAFRSTLPATIILGRRSSTRKCSSSAARCSRIRQPFGRNYPKLRVTFFTACDTRSKRYYSEQRVGQHWTTAAGREREMKR
jgi:hypothetical protein